MTSPESNPLDGHELVFQFKGNASEYFKIWIVNVFLTIITLGIFFAWARVRSQRYFYGNTYLDGHNFDYHAKPISILIGWAVIISVFAAYNVLISFYPYLGIGSIIFIFIYPFILNNAIAFNARMTSYRNVRFGFKGTYWSAFGAFIVLPVLAVFTLGILSPFASRATSNYVGKKTKFGDWRFDTNTKASEMYTGLIHAFLIVVIISILLYGLFQLTFIHGTFSSAESAEASLQLFSGVIPFLVLIPINIYVAHVRNKSFNSTVFGNENKLRSFLSPTKYTWIVASNLVVTVLSLGLLRPWAAVRKRRYLTGNTTIIIAEPLDTIIDKAGSGGDVVSSSFLSFEGLGVGL